VTFGTEAGATTLRALWLSCISKRVYWGKGSR
jgi:hypothetical protein